ncbi:MAG: hypothetical protein FJW14_08565 [Acidimicrobiia bacterium]|nr:hypothetical protein [Acidimicrobiia bacterium]
MARALWKGPIAFGLVKPDRGHPLLRQGRGDRRPLFETSYDLHDAWDPSQFTDEYRENLMRIVRARMKGKEPKLVFSSL